MTSPLAVSGTASAVETPWGSALVPAGVDGRQLRPPRAIGDRGRRVGAERRRSSALFDAELGVHADVPGSRTSRRRARCRPAPGRCTSRPAGLRRGSSSGGSPSWAPGSSSRAASPRRGATGAHGPPRRPATPPVRVRTPGRVRAPGPSAQPGWRGSGDRARSARRSTKASESTPSGPTLPTSGSVTIVTGSASSCDHPGHHLGGDARRRSPPRRSRLTTVWPSEKQDPAWRRQRGTMPRESSGG